MEYRVTKRIGGFSTCFRQWRAAGTHCKFLHGYGIYFDVVFAAEELDARNWVQDFGFLSRSDYKVGNMQIKEYFKFLFDHTTVVAEDDPDYNIFCSLESAGLIQLRTMETVGCEKFAEHVYIILHQMLMSDENTRGRVRLISVTCHEHENNSASYGVPSHV